MISNSVCRVVVRCAVLDTMTVFSVERASRYDSASHADALGSREAISAFRVLDRGRRFEVCCRQ